MLPTQPSQPSYGPHKSSWSVKTIVSAAIGVAILLMVYATFFTSCKKNSDGQSTAKSLACSLGRVGDFISKNLKSIYALIWTSVIAGVLATGAGIFGKRKQNGPDDPVDPVDPVDPIDPINPDPIDPVDPVDPVEGVD